MDVIGNVLDLIMGTISKVTNWIDAILGTFLAGQNQFLILAVILYIIGVFGTAKVRLNVKTGGGK